MWLEKYRSGLVLFKLKKVLKTWQITNTELMEILNKYGYLIPLHRETKMKGGITVIDGQIAAWPGRNSWELEHIKKHFTPSLALIWVRRDEFLLAFSFVDGLILVTQWKQSFCGFASPRGEARLGFL